MALDTQNYQILLKKNATHKKIFYKDIVLEEKMVREDNDKEMNYAERNV